MKLEHVRFGASEGRTVLCHGLQNILCLLLLVGMALLGRLAGVELLELENGSRAGG